MSIQDLGHSRPRDYVSSRFGVSLSHARELRMLEEKLAGLPELRRAFLSGVLPRSKARLLVGVASAKTEAGWIEFARRLSVRRLPEVIAAWKQEAGGLRAEREDLPV